MPSRTLATVGRREIGRRSFWIEAGGCVLGTGTTSADFQIGSQLKSSRTTVTGGLNMYGELIDSPTLFRMVPSTTSYGLHFPRIGGLQLSYPLLSQKQVKLRTSNLAGTFTGPIQIKAHTKFRINGAWAYPGTAQVFWGTPIISGTGKATDFKFCKNIHRVDRNKGP